MPARSTITLRTGGSFVHHADSFAIARGGHLDLCVLGAFEVAENGDIANWARSPHEPTKQVGGAMDLAIGAQAAVGGDGAHHQGPWRLAYRQRCSYPLTAKGVVKRVYTDLAVLDVTPDGFVVRDMIPGMTRETLQARTRSGVAGAGHDHGIEITAARAVCRRRGRSARSAPMSGSTAWRSARSIRRIRRNRGIALLDKAPRNADWHGRVSQRLHPAASGGSLQGQRARCCMR